MEIVLDDGMMAFDSECYGCEKFKKDVMVSFVVDKEFYDLFLTQERAEEFYERLGKILKQNRENNDKTN